MNFKNLTQARVIHEKYPWLNFDTGKLYYLPDVDLDVQEYDNTTLFSELDTGWYYYWTDEPILMNQIFGVIRHKGKAEAVRVVSEVEFLLIKNKFAKDLGDEFHDILYINHYKYDCLSEDSDECTDHLMI